VAAREPESALALLEEEGLNLPFLVDLQHQ
jgi:hypothetical protein